MAIALTWLFNMRRLSFHPEICSRKFADTLADNPYLASLVKGISLQPRSHSRSAAKAFRSLVTLDGLQRITLGAYMADRCNDWGGHERFMGSGFPNLVLSKLNFARLFHILRRLCKDVHGNITTSLTFLYVTSSNIYVMHNKFVIFPISGRKQCDLNNLCSLVNL